MKPIKMIWHNDLPVTVTPLIAAEMMISAWTVKIMVVGDLDKAIVTRWRETLLDIAQRQPTANSAFVISHLEVIHGQLAAGKTAQDVEVYLQRLKEYYQ